LRLSQHGFTLLEVLLAGFILFLTLTSMTLVYQGAALSSAKAQESVAASALIPSIKALIVEDFYNKSPIGAPSGEGSMGGYDFVWQATLRAQARPSLIFMEDNELDPTFNYSLWDIDFFLVKGAISRHYRFSEVRS